MRSSVTVIPPNEPDPVTCEEFGYGLGKVDGILLVRYRVHQQLSFGETRQDFLHQLYWSPAGRLWAKAGAGGRVTPRGTGFWAARGATHEVRALGGDVVYRICLRETPEALGELRCGPVTLSADAATAVPRLATPGFDGDAAGERATVLAGLQVATDDAPATDLAASVAAALARDPADPASLAEWAGRLHVSVKTLQRDFQRTYGLSFSAWRSRHRLRTAQLLLADRPVAEVARRVGYASPSAFVAAYSRRYGHTPGQAAARSA